ncbi:MAG: hypothetical protein Pg6C_04650 [Treponemataceae bacterium]|nr:MAG: hypothetical protein Pg6C_04650 [Treponemataceae bacterium]
MKKEKTLWHTAFVQALQLELEDYADALEFKAEYRLTTEPLRIDVVVVKKKADAVIEKNIGRIFRTHNIVEFKSPRDSFSASDLTKTFAYFFLYAAIEAADIRDCTLSLIGARKPAAVIDCLKKMFGYRVEKNAAGVYYVHGQAFPIQIIETKRLPERENLWLASLRDDLTVQSAERVLAESGKRREPGIAAYLYALTTARSKVFTEVWNMTKRQKEFEQFLTQVAEESGQLEKWRQEAAYQKTLETARKMLAKGYDRDEILEINGLAPADIAAL